MGHNYKWNISLERGIEIAHTLIIDILRESTKPLPLNELVFLLNSRSKEYKIHNNKKQNKDLDHTLFIKYCKCIKNLKYNQKVEPGSEYPICTSSIYNKRGFTPPKNIKMKCKMYR